MVYTYGELKKKIKSIQEIIKAYEINEDSIFEDERRLAQGLLIDIVEEIKSIKFGEENTVTLYQYLTQTETGLEIAVHDKDYDIEEMYFYNDIPDEDNKWQRTMLELAKLLIVTDIQDDCVIVNLSEIINNKLKQLKNADLFIDCDIDSIMYDMKNIISGYVSEKWLEKFVNVLKEN